MTKFIRDKYGNRTMVSDDTDDFNWADEVTFKNKLEYIDLNQLEIPQYNDEGPRGRTQNVEDFGERDQAIKDATKYRRRLRKYRFVWRESS